MYSSRESLLIKVDYLVLSKLVFDWADSYDAKVGRRSHLEVSKF